MRLSRLAVVLLALLVPACSGDSDGSSPTEPTSPVSLEGSWSGSVTITSPSRSTCTLSLALTRDEQDYFGDWNGQCDGTQGGGIAVVTTVLGNQVLVVGLQGQPVFGGCGWSSLATRSGNRLRGDWSTPQNCQTGPALRGQMELTKR
jgi:hypothetical protein